LIGLLQGQRLVAADVVELAPGLDPSECSSVLAAKVVRSLLFSLAAASAP
jgi:agmatinase